MIKNLALIGIFAVTSVATISVGTMRTTTKGKASQSLTDTVRPSRPAPQGFCYPGLVRC